MEHLQIISLFYLLTTYHQTSQSWGSNPGVCIGDRPEFTPLSQLDSSISTCGIFVHIKGIYFAEVCTPVQLLPLTEASIRIYQLHHCDLYGLYPFLVQDK